jgi:hypothetical protein
MDSPLTCVSLWARLSLFSCPLPLLMLAETLMPQPPEPAPTPTPTEPPLDELVPRERSVSWLEVRLMSRLAFSSASLPAQRELLAMMEVTAKPKKRSAG